MVMARGGMSIANEQLYRVLGRFETGPHDDPRCRLTAEGAALDAYLCSADKPTIAFGCTFHPDGTPVQMGDSITADQVYLYTEAAVARVVADVTRIVKRPLNPYQMAATCSFVFNLGGGNLATSTRLLPALNDGRWEDAAEAMGEFNRAWGKLRHTDGSMRWHRKAELGLLIRRYAEGCLLLGLDWEKWCTTRKISLHENLLWQPDWVDPKGVRKGGRYFDEILPTTTQFHVIEDMARATPLPPLESPIAEKPLPDLVLTTPAPAPQASGNGAAPARPPSPAQASAPIEKPASVGPPPATAPPAKIPAPQRAPEGTVVLPSQVPKPPRLPDPPVPIGQQREAIEAGTRQQDWSEGTKAMWQSRRFYGLVLIMAGRLWMLKTGSNAFLGAVSDPLVMEFIGGFGVMIAGELIQSWGKAKAKKALH